uniref:Telomere repeat binding bouquet formation protein 2 n=1 Tax=Anas zonorhyncha TaxID=75864 RepID=A0A8B9UEY8_9AVES
MFRGRRAWFSRSVQPGPQQLWVAGGGLLTRWQDADYLFSSDAAHPDTLRIHESREYLDGRATVFHSCYLSAWANTSAEMKESVVLGHFVLPPACLQKGEGEHQVAAALCIPQYTQGCQLASILGPLYWHFPSPGYTSARDMKKYVGELCDFIPGTSGYTAYWIQNEIKVYSDVKTKMKRKL